MATRLKAYKNKYHKDREQELLISTYYYDMKVLARLYEENNLFDAFEELLYFLGDYKNWNIEEKLQHIKNKLQVKNKINNETSEKIIDLLYKILESPDLNLKYNYDDKIDFLKGELSELIIRNILNKKYKKEGSLWKIKDNSSLILGDEELVTKKKRTFDTLIFHEIMERGEFYEVKSSTDFINSDVCNLFTLVDNKLKENNIERVLAFVIFKSIRHITTEMKKENGKCKLSTLNNCLSIGYLENFSGEEYKNVRDKNIFFYSTKDIIKLKNTCFK